VPAKRAHGFTWQIVSSCVWSLGGTDRVRPPLYFVKVDIKAAFDTIKQDKMLKIVEELLDKVRSP
jgi:hypothetical protein